MTLEPALGLSVMVVDDSALARQVLSTLLTAAGMQVQVAHDPLFALQKMERWRPDVLVLDLEMPRMDGLTFLRLLKKGHDIPVVVCSAVTEERGEKALRALEQGAVEVVTKPKTGLREFLYESAIILVDAVRAAAQTRPAFERSRVGRAPDLPRPALPRRRADRLLVAIGASTGGPEAVRRILADWPSDGPPIVVVQHMPEGFTRPFAARLDESSRIDVREAKSGDVLESGLALIAPGGRHLSVRRRLDRLLVEVADGPLVSRHRPSVDVLFRSVAEAAGSQAVGVLLTGMGDDGANGLRIMKEAGAPTLAQDEASSVVFGMPKAAIDVHAVDEVLPLERMAEAIMKRC